MLYLATLITLASYVVADQTFQLTAVGTTINTPVTVSNDQLTLKNGSADTFTLEEPSGYMTDGGKYLEVTASGIFLTSDLSQASKDWGFTDGALRANVGSTFYACPSGDAYYLQTFECTGGEQVTISASGSAAATTDATTAAATTSTKAATSTAETTSAAAETTAAVTTAAVSSAAAATVTDVSSTLVTITSCSAGCNATASVESSVNGAGQVHVALGAFAVAGALLL